MYREVLSSVGEGSTWCIECKEFSDSVEHERDLPLHPRKPILSKTHSDGWCVVAQVSRDYHVWSEFFYATSRDGYVIADLRNGKNSFIVSNSKTTLEQFLDCHPLDYFDYSDI